MGILPVRGWKHSTYQKNRRKLVGLLGTHENGLRCQTAGAGKAGCPAQRFLREELKGSLPRQTKSSEHWPCD